MKQFDTGLLSTVGSFPKVAGSNPTLKSRESRASLCEGSCVQIENLV